MTMRSVAIIRPTKRKKKCQTCKKAKPVVSFYRSKKCADGYMSACKSCHISKVRVQHNVCAQAQKRLMHLEQKISEAVQARDAFLEKIKQAVNRHK